MPTLPYETARLWLRPTSPADAPFVLELMNSPAWLHYIGDRQVHDLAAAEAYIRTKMMPQYARLGYGNYTLRRKSDGVAIGSCGLYDRPGLEGVDIGFALLPAYCRQGYAYEAAQKVLALAFEAFGLERVQAITTHDNHASQGLLEKLGLIRERSLTLPEEPDTPLWLYGLTRAAAGG